MATRVARAFEAVAVSELTKTYQKVEDALDCSSTYAPIGNVSYNLRSIVNMVVYSFPVWFWCEMSMNVDGIDDLLIFQIIQIVLGY